MGKIGDAIRELKEVDSTNRYAEKLVKGRPVEEGLVIQADFQTTGKGQGEKRWESEPGRNLTFTVVLHPDFLPPARQFTINKVISLGVTDYLACYADGICVKWPNDILIGRKKVAGILIKHIVEGETLQTTLVGIGVNINQTRFPRRLSHAVSLAQILKRELVLKEALVLLCDTLEKRYDQLRKNETETLESDYCQTLLGYQTERQFLVDGLTVPGIIRGVDRFGRLLVQHPGKPVKAYGHGEIEFLF